MTDVGELFRTIAFLGFGGLTVGSAVFVVAFRNILHAAGASVDSPTTSPCRPFSLRFGPPEGYLTKT